VCVVRGRQKRTETDDEKRVEEGKEEGGREGGRESFCITEEMDELEAKGGWMSYKLKGSLTQKRRERKKKKKTHKSGERQRRARKINENGRVLCSALHPLQNACTYSLPPSLPPSSPSSPCPLGLQKW